MFAPNNAHSTCAENLLGHLWPSHKPVLCVKHCGLELARDSQSFYRTTETQASSQTLIARRVCGYVSFSSPGSILCPCLTSSMPTEAKDYWFFLLVLPSDFYLNVHGRRWGTRRKPEGKLRIMVFIRPIPSVCSFYVPLRPQLSLLCSCQVPVALLLPLATVGLGEVIDSFIICWVP